MAESYHRNIRHFLADPKPADPELQTAVENLLWKVSDWAKCFVCKHDKGAGHARNCEVGKLHAILNSRVPRTTPTVECSGAHKT